MKPLIKVQIAPIFLLLLLNSASSSFPCVPRDYGEGSIVCVCDATYCDTVAPPGDAPYSQNDGQFVHYVSTKSGWRLQKENLAEPRRANEITNDPEYRIRVDFSQQYQKLDGFGGAFTDSFGLNVASLPNSAQSRLLESYFGANGIKYNMGRVPMASCDFSMGTYSYADVPFDFELKHFALADADLKFKIPLILRAQNLSQGRLRIIGTPWSAPYWMKTNQKMIGKGSLIGQPGGQYYKSYANYFVKFLQEYEKRDVKIWGLTVQNEPLTGFTDHRWQATGFTAEMERDFIKSDLGPALRANRYGQVKLMILDESRSRLPEWANVVYGDPEVKKYVSHVALHWFGNRNVPIEKLDETHALYPDLSLIGTEACHGDDDNRVKLGSWERAEDYATDIIQTLNHWYTGWMDWNMALDSKGGPNWVSNFVDSPVIVNATSGEFYKQPMFYAMGHFSTFLQRGAIRVNTTIRVDDPNVLATAFLNPDGVKVMVLLNKNDFDLKIKVEQYEDSGATIAPAFYMPKKSIVTSLWK